MLQGKTGPRVALKYEGKSLTPRPPLVPRVAHDNRPHPVPDPHPLLALGTRSRIIPGAGSHSPSGSSKDLHEDNLDRQRLHWLSATDMFPLLHWLSLGGSAEQEVSTQAKAGPLRKATGNAPKASSRSALPRDPSSLPRLVVIPSSRPWWR
ncbi:hypothetical protein Celaphus_00003917, partial [Cervus elaphus hippelaphus]